ncbi:MAG TPA: class I SAM-dependent methyltransferase [Streptosporangiaceae bacterium]
MDAQDLSALHAHYSLGRERDRLSIDARGALEFERTTEIIARYLPGAPAVVADIGGGPGRYSLWLAGHGYQVEHRDLMPLHVAQLAAEVPPGGAVSTLVADARDLDLAEGSADAVLLLGPLYHLRHRADRLAALAEARRIVRPGGPVFAAAISRWAPRLDGELRQRLYLDFPVAREVSLCAERTGRLAPLRDGGFSAYCHRPGQLRAEVRAAGLDVADLVSVEGAGFWMADLAERMADPLDWQVVLDTARATERVAELLGIGPHLLVTAVRPPAQV